MRQKLFWQRFCIYNRSENCWAAQHRTAARQLGNIKYFWHRCSGWEGRGKKTSQGEKCGDYIDNDPRFGINYELLIFRSHISLHTAQLLELQTIHQFSQSQWRGWKCQLHIALSHLRHYANQPAPFDLCVSVPILMSTHCVWVPV